MSELADVLHYSKGYLSKVENGVKPPTQEFALRCEQVLNADGELFRKGTAEPVAGVRRTTPPRPPGTRTAAAPIVPRQLPPAGGTFVGRGAELALLNQLADTAPTASGAVPLAAITGTAGIGKTALALHWAHSQAARYPDGQLYMNLRGLDPSGPAVSPADAIRSFLAALGVPDSHIPPDSDAREALYRSILADRRVLVVLDDARNAEHARPLVPAGTGCLVLVTSRDRLYGLVTGLGARPVSLGLFSYTDAHELLVRRLGAKCVHAEPHTAEELIELCAGLPLAVNIAAARAVAQPSMTLVEQVRGMRSARRRLDALDLGEATADARTAFSWSYRLLDGSTARLFRMQAMNPGPEVSLAAAASLTATTAQEARRDLDELVRTHLLTPCGPNRWTCHDLLRVYAQEQARENPAEKRLARARALDHYLFSAQNAAACLSPQNASIVTRSPRDGVVPERFADQAEASAWFEAEYTTLTAAVSLAADVPSSPYAWQLARLLLTFQDRTSRWHDLAEVQRVALTAATEAADGPGMASAHRGLARAALRTRRFEACRTHLARAMDLAHELDDRMSEAAVRHELSVVHEQEGDFALALAEARRALEIFESAGTGTGIANGLSTVGWFQAMTGDHTGALESCLRALDLHSDLTDTWGAADTWDSLGYVHHCLADHDAAVAAFQRAVNLFRTSGDRYYEAGSLVRLGQSHDAAGRRDEALRAWGSALGLLKALRHPDADRVRALITPTTNHP
ncbi:hypothetical protein GCM10009838_54630 [Catenulispora subtropica]|uniref:HTH cro/C1-type domain-containing protein n=1 Tax=Catenulispora subtropica TaxID=450798 RepID=A0ABN2SGN3_9ACTN